MKQGNLFDVIMDIVRLYGQIKYEQGQAAILSPQTEDNYKLNAELAFQQAANFLESLEIT